MKPFQLKESSVIDAIETPVDNKVKHWRNHSTQKNPLTEVLEKIVKSQLQISNCFWAHDRLHKWQNKESIAAELSVKLVSLPRTIGAKDNQRVTGICWPRMNCEAAALKKGSRAVKTSKQVVNY